MPWTPLNPPIYQDIRVYTGDPNVPHDVRLRRQSNTEVMRRMGTPVLLKHMFSPIDVEAGTATESPSFDSVYGQSTYLGDQLSHGVGFVSVETQPNEWYDPATGNLYTATTKPDPSYLPAPKYRGYGPGYLTYAILPDRPEDMWRLTEQGALLQQQTATAQLPWWPPINDNDILIVVSVAPNGLIQDTYERYQMKMTMPITIRGLDQAGFREPGIIQDAPGNRYWIGQQADLVRLQPMDEIYNVEVDR
jgi:hypothetical protein